MKSRGFTLVELMISMTIGLLIVAGLLSALVTSSSTGKTRERASAIQLNGRYAVDFLKRDLQHAGFLGITSLFAPDEPVAFPVTNVCNPATIGQISLRIWGADDNPYAGSCLPANQYGGSDVLVVRRLSSNTVTAPFLSSLIYYRSAYEGGTAFVGPTPPDFSGTNRQPPYQDYLLQESVYYISPYTNSASESPRVPALYRLRLDSGPAMVPELIASGIEQMQVRYGVFASDGSARYVQASAVTDWDNVGSIEISLLVRSDALEPGYRNTTTYTLGDEDVTVNDGFRRQVFSSVIQLRN
jgi:type IV pilus assembly protein PilW